MCCTWLRLPSTNTAQVSSRPAAIAVALVIPLTCTGVALQKPPQSGPVVVPFPSRALAPQQSIWPVLRSAQTWSSPAAVAVAFVMPLTCTGVALQEPPQSGPVVVPFPSCPSMFEPTLFGHPALVIGLSLERSKRVMRLPAERARDLHGRPQPLAQRLRIGVGCRPEAAARSGCARRRRGRAPVLAGPRHDARRSPPEPIRSSELGARSSELA